MNLFTTSVRSFFHGFCKAHLKVFLAILPGILFSPSIKAQWHELSGPPSGPVNDFTQIDSSGRIYAATNNGVYRTTDTTHSWQLMGLADREVLKITQYQIPGQEILLAIVRVGSPWMLCRSDDSAKTWDTVFTSTSSILEVFQDGKDVVIGVAGSSFDTTAGIYRSSNLGATWSHQAAGPPNRNLLTDFTLGGGEIVAIVADSVNDKSIWSMPSNGSAWGPTTYPYWHRPQCLKFVGADLFVGGSGRIDISTDKGITWLPVPNNGLDTTKDYFSTFAANGLTIIAAGWSGAYRSTDGGGDWLHIEGTGGYQRANGVAAIAFLDNQFFAGANAGVVVSPDGLTWKYATDGIVGEILDVISNDTLLFALTRRGVFRSSNQGTTWIEPNSGSDLQDSLASSLYNLGGEIYATGPGLLLPSTGIASSTGLWRWNGSGWITLTDIPAISIADDNGRLFASLGSDGLEESTDNGVSWIDASNGLPFDTSSTVSTVSSGGRILAFVLPPGVLPQDRLVQVYGSDDEGVSWRFLDTLPRRGYIISASTSDGNVYVGGNWGLAKSTDLGEHWTSILQEVRQIRQLSSWLVITTEDSIYFIGNADVSILSDSLTGGLNGFTNDKQFAYAATDSRGIWAESLANIPLSVEPKAPTVADQYTIQVYPNPSGNNATISFDLLDREVISLRLFDERGVCLATLFDGAAGPGEVTIPVSLALLPGAYEVQLSGDRGTASANIAIERNGRN